eukprot:TRINITY_DN372_c0_g1_i2.p1 TRINITY_DN372_c0_g1~~TRINITY_DN372_c0_g1_i2.p1  ORF type:complete len:128 (-),score=28.85 TRINITY_DN372_c0_g1_i2:104-487(-)
MISECVRDFEEDTIFPGYGWSDKEEHKKKIRTAIAKWFPRFERIISSDGFCVGNTPYYCDFLLLNSLLYVEEIIGEEAFQGFNRLSTLKTRVKELPRIKQFLASEKRKGLVDDVYKAVVIRVFDFKF